MRRILQKKRLLFTGISGFLGWHFSRLPLPEWEVHGIVHTHPVRYPGITIHTVDITDKQMVTALVDAIQPDTIVHAAAYSSPNACEQTPGHSYRVNVESTIHIATVCFQRNIPLLFTSTDLVFDGDHAPYTEADEPRPINSYGKHKREAEQEILQRCPQGLVVRLPLMFGDPGPVATNFFAEMRSSLMYDHPLHLFHDEFRSMIHGAVAVGGMMTLLGKASGIYHLGGRERVSRYQFGQLLAKFLGKNSDFLNPVTQNSVQMPAARPRDVTLDSSTAYSLGFDPPPLFEQLTENELAH